MPRAQWRRINAQRRMAGLSRHKTNAVHATVFQTAYWRLGRAGLRNSG
jgi:hypothetical protein